MTSGNEVREYYFIWFVKPRKYGVVYQVLDSTNEHYMDMAVDKAMVDRMFSGSIERYIGTRKIQKIDGPFKARWIR